METTIIWNEGKREKVIREIAPDFILAAHAVRALENFAETSRCREKWYGRNLEPNQTESQEIKKQKIINWAFNKDNDLPF